MNTDINEAIILAEEIKANLIQIYQEYSIGRQRTALDLSLATNNKILKLNILTTQVSKDMVANELTSQPKLTIV